MRERKMTAKEWAEANANQPDDMDFDDAQFDVGSDGSLLIQIRDAMPSAFLDHGQVRQLLSWLRFYYPEEWAEVAKETP